MKLSDVVNEIQEYIDKEGDREVNSIQIVNDKMNLAVLRMNKTLVCNDGRHASINFYELK